MIARAKANRRTSEEMRAAVLAAIESILAAGDYPGGDRLGALAGCTRTSAEYWRDRLRGEGLVTFEPRRSGPKPGTPQRDGLLGESPEEVAEIEARYAEVRAERIARCAPATEIHQPRVARVGRYSPPPAEEGGGL